MRYSVITDFGTDSEILCSNNHADYIVDWLKAQKDVRGMTVCDNTAPIGERNMTVEEFLRRHIIPEIFSKVVPKYYTMDPKTEDMLPNARHLADGMRVLIADPDSREYPSVLSAEPPVEWLREKLLERNQWCTVSHLELTKNDSMVSFVGVYEDGTKRQRFMGAGHAWLVKIDSIEESMVLAMARATKIQDLVQEAMTIAARVVTGEASDETKADELTITIQETTKSILGSLG